MSQYPHDQYAKEYLAHLLADVADVQLGAEVLAEARRVDVYVAPKVTAREEDYQALGVLGRMTRQVCLLEPFSQPPSSEDVCQCLGKLFATQHRLQRRQAKLKLPPWPTTALPCLWILTPTASVALLAEFGGQVQADWGDGIYWLAPRFKTAIVALHHLPNTPDTAWLRALGRGTKQQRAFQELLGPPELPDDDSKGRLRQRVAGVLHSYLLWLQTQVNSTDEQEVLMSLLALHEQWERETLRKGRQEGRREVVETLLKSRFGADDSVLQRLDTLLQLPLTELLPWLLNVSREELRAKLGLT
jgi:hypothetical protein